MQGCEHVLALSAFGVDSQIQRCRRLHGAPDGKDWVMFEPGLQGLDDPVGQLGTDSERQRSVGAIGAACEPGPFVFVQRRTQLAPLGRRQSIRSQNEETPGVAFTRQMAIPAQPAQACEHALGHEAAVASPQIRVLAEKAAQNEIRGGIEREDPAQCARAADEQCRPNRIR